MSTVEISALRKSYGTMEVVHGIDLEVTDGEFVVLVGPSGCGKSTILRMVCGLEEITGGTISINGTVVNNLPPKKRDVAMVFQDYALYPHMTVAENMAFGLRMRKVPKTERAAAVARAAEILQISHLLNRRPRQLSGGQRQRVAMGRAIVRSPSLFLYDEPLSNLDAKLRIDMRAEIKKLHEAVGTTSIFVTHDQIEAMTLADRIVCLSNGRAAQIGTPDELYNYPADLFVASFIGAPTINLLAGKLAKGDEGARLVTDDGLALPLPASMAELKAVEITAGFRPENVTLLAAEGQHALGDGDLVAEVEYSEQMGSDTFVHMRLAGNPIVARCDPSRWFVKRQNVCLTVDPSHVHVFDTLSGKRLGPMKA